MTRAPSASMAAMADALLCDDRLSHTTTSPAQSSGTKACSTYVSKTWRSVAPGNASGAITPDRRIPEIKVPTLIIWGGRDRLVPPDDAQRFHQDIAGSALAIFDKLGHAPEEEDPAATVAAVKQFLGLK